jgi:hypothetical protein
MGVLSSGYVRRILVTELAQLWSNEIENRSSGSKIAGRSTSFPVYEKLISGLISGEMRGPA